MQTAAAPCAHPGGRCCWVIGQARRCAVHHVPGRVKLEHVGLAQQGHAVKGGSLHGGGLVCQGLLQGGIDV